MTLEPRDRVVQLSWYYLLLQFLAAYVVLGVRCQTWRYMDDGIGDPYTGLMPTYSPTDKWSPGQDCSICVAQPDKNSAFQGSWHDGTFDSGDTQPLSISFNFTGSALNVYCIMDNQIGYTTNTSLTFTLDGDTVGPPFTHSPDPTAPPFQYNVSVYSNSSIPDGLHQFTMSAGGNNDSLVLFDYAAYLFQDTSTSPITSSSSSSSTSSTSSATAVPSSRGGSSNAGIISGATLGGVALLLLAVALVWLLRRRRQTKRIEDANNPAYASISQQSLPAYPSFYPSLINQSPIRPDILHDSTTSTSPSTLSLTSPGGHQRPSPLARPVTAASMREAEIKRQLLRYERTVATLQQKDGSVRRLQSVHTTSAAREENRRLRDEIAAMQAEMERLRQERTNLLWEMESTPPPEYGESLEFDREHRIIERDANV